MNPNNGISSVYDKIKSLPASQQEEILHDIHEVYSHRPEMAMVDSVKGITNLHIPSDVIVDASMPAMIRNSGQMWGKDGKQKDTKAVMPESTYARIYQEMINFCKTNGAFDPTTMGSVPNVGLMAQKAEEYGSHDKTFEMTADGTMRVVLADGSVLMQHEVETGDIWRACQTKARDPRLGQAGRHRARASPTPAIFWLDLSAPTTANCARRSSCTSRTTTLTGLDISIMGYNEAIRVSMERLIRGKDTISVTGNVLRDYLTDLFPIMELGTSAKMLSIVPLMAGGGMYENRRRRLRHPSTSSNWGENYLRWTPGRVPGLAVSLRKPGSRPATPKAKLLGKALDEATGKLDNNKVAVAQGRRHRQPRQPLLPGDVAPGPGRPGRRRRTESALRTAGQGPDRAGSDHRRRTQCGSGAGRDRRLLALQPELTSKVSAPAPPSTQRSTAWPDASR